jgi:hypothetical protein
MSVRVIPSRKLTLLRLRRLARGGQMEPYGDPISGDGMIQ